MSGNGIYQRDKKKHYLGTGLAFPLQMNATNQLKLVSSDEDIRQAIVIILETVPGERLMRPEFGCRIHELLFAPYDSATEALIIYYVEEALARWEPRIDLSQVEVEADRGEGRVLVNIHYTIKATHDVRSIVHPFYIEAEG